MSSYLSIYIVPKRKTEKEEKQHIMITSFSRSNEIYQYFEENINPVFVSNWDDVPYTTVTRDGIRAVLQGFDDDIKKATDRLLEYEKYAKDNPDYIQEIIDLKEYIRDLQYWRDKTSFIQNIICDINFCNTIEEVCCNID